MYRIGLKTLLARILMNYKTIFYGAVFGLLTVAVGAFGAHALEGVLVENQRLDTFQTAVDYQGFHALALMVVGILQGKIDSKLLRTSSYAFLLGILLFSGSLYYLSLTNNTAVALVTPFGGLSFMTGWVLVLLALYKTSKTQHSAD